MSARVLQSFRPFVDNQSRVLILGSMPGPEALRKQQYYGFEGNHFWTIIPQIFGLDRPSHYNDRLELVRKKKIALWDVLARCIRPGALDSSIRQPETNKIPELLITYRNIQAIFINGRYAYSLFEKKISSQVDRPYFYLPSSSPAHAAMKLSEKIKHWSEIKKYLI